MPQLNAYTYLSISTYTLLSFIIFYYIFKCKIFPLFLEKSSYINSLTVSTPTDKTSSNIFFPF